jgi:hypothetical protein
MLMGELFSSIMALTALVIVVIVAVIVQQKWGPKKLFWVWLASAVIITGTYWSWVSYTHGFPLPSTRQKLFTVAIVSAFLFMAVTLLVGIAIWCVASFGPRPLQDSSTEINYFPFNMPTGPRPSEGRFFGQARLFYGAKRQGSSGRARQQCASRL